MMLFSVELCKAREEAGPVITTVDHADIRGLVTTLLMADLRFVVAPDSPSMQLWPEKANPRWIRRSVFPSRRSHFV